MKKSIIRQYSFLDLGLYSIISQKSAVDMLVVICRAACEATGIERQKSDDIFPTLIKVLTAFKSFPLSDRIYAHRLIVALDKIVAGDRQHVDATFRELKRRPLQEILNELR